MVTVLIVQWYATYYTVFIVNILFKVTPFNDTDPIIPMVTETICHTHIVDLVDMRKFSTLYRGEVVNFIISVEDEMTRKLWTEPIATKNPEEVCHHIRRIWSREGPPKILRNDCGKEFEGKLSMHNTLYTAHTVYIMYRSI